MVVTTGWAPAERSRDWLLLPFEASRLAPVWIGLGLAIAYPLFVGLVHMLAQALLAGGNKAHLDEAIKHLRRALVHENSSAIGYRQLASAYARKRKIPHAELASAQAYFYEGNLKLAKQQARRAKSKFRPGTPSWIKADDILTFRPPKR